MNIKVISEDIIKLSHPTPDHLRLLPTSLFDQANSPVLMPRIFFYHSHYSITNISTNEVLDRLKASLPNTLSMFYPLGGRVMYVNHINCNDEGIPYVQAEVDKQLEDVVHKAEVSQLDKLLPQYGLEGRTCLLLAIQVNVFACGGLAIGVKINHAIADAFSLSKFVITWASMAKGNDNNNMLLDHPTFNIWKHFPPPKSSNMDDAIVDLDLTPIKDTQPVTKWFMFSQTKLDALRSSIMVSYANTDNNTSNDDPNLCNYRNSLPSLAMVLSSFIWSRIKVACYNSANKIPYELFHAVNLRSQVSPPDDQSYYFGNMAVNVMVKPSMTLEDGNNSSIDSLWWRDIMRQSKESIGNIISNDGFIREMKEGKVNLRLCMMEYFERAEKKKIVLHGFSNLQSLPVYEADFGWGKPVWVTSATLRFKDLVILIPAGPSSRDIVAYINLSSEHMAKLESDLEFIAFVSKAPCVSV